MKTTLTRLFGLCLLVLLNIALNTPTLAAERVTWYHHDLQGSPVAATDRNGEMVWREQYKPYGQRTLKEDDGSNKLWYTGKAHEEGTRLSYFGARWYHPEIGRFMSVDPVDFTEDNVQSFNRYAYANNNPYRYADPDGESPLDLVFLAYDVGKLGVAIYTGQGVGAALGDVGTSLVGVASPIPGTGQAIKAAKAAAKAGEAVGKAGKVTKKADGYVDLASSQRRKHILDGDATGGGHRPGTGKPGKSEFPQGWSDDRIMHNISDVATDPNSVTHAGRGGRSITEGTRDGVNIRVIQERNGDIVSGFPTNVPRNP